MMVKSLSMCLSGMCLLPVAQMTDLARFSERSENKTQATERIHIAVRTLKAI